MGNKQRISLLCGTLMLLGLGWGFSQFFSPSHVHAAGVAGDKPPLAPQPVDLPSKPADSPKSFPVDEKTVDGWVSNDDQKAIREHGWALWQGITAITKDSQGWPVYDTWYTDTEVEAGRPTSPRSALFAATRATGRPTHHFEVFRQFHHAKTLAGRRILPALTAGAKPGGLQVLGFNKFNTDYANFVWNNNYNTAAGLWNVQNSWPVGTPPAQRTITSFVNTSVGLKPVYQFVNGPKHSGGITVVTYWLGDLTTGPTNSSNPANPTPDTWNQCVAVYTTSSAPTSQLPNCPNGQPANAFVSVNEFFNFALSAAEAKSVCANEQGCTVQAGDFAILVAMHMTSRENANWTWQTFWWNYNQPFPYGAPPASIAKPFSNYAMCTAYSMTTDPPNSLTGKNLLCYNPYLETGLSGVVGIQSNCMSCHTTAAYGNNFNNPPVTNTNFVQANPNYPSFLNMSNFIAPTDQNDAYYYYACNTKTDFSWFLAGSVAGGGAPANITACSNPAGSPPTSGSSAKSKSKTPAHKRAKKS
ncbi:MAG TPA: hypothetical protein VJW20_13935 [Candidatus Angelobacter sp.]|nr:hypothetical protein [Candidatus Angelobacter sp.]